MVVLDCDNGEVLVMASTPSYDPNKFIPNISQKDYDALRKNPANPLVSRAFQGKYPPASTFKVITVLSALKNGIITENTTIDCPASITIGNHTFNNWSKSPAGSINCVRAIALSNNPFMYQVGMRLGGDKNARVAADRLLDTARLYGYGARTKLPISDQAGLVPDNNYMVNVFRRSFMFGDVANMAIGQGVLLATPLQVAHAMAGIANGVGLPKLQIVKQIQDSDANVVYCANKEIQTPLAEYAPAAAVVRKGMREVVEGGTGSRARLSYSSIAGKSGTAQWGPEREDRRLAWFAGFMPVEKPRYAYAVLYEGLPHERIGGGAKAAPIVKDFFESVKDDIKKELADAEKEAAPVAVAADPEDDDDDSSSRKSNKSSDGTDVQVMEIKEIDDSSDTPSSSNVKGSGYSSEMSMYPQPGDADYIPGLQRQIPRSIGASSRRSQNTNTEEEIPVAEPLD
jgi:penicillin-binding protein 2